MKIIIDSRILDEYFKDLLKNDSVFHWSMLKSAWNCFVYELRRRSGIYFENDR